MINNISIIENNINNTKAQIGNSNGYIRGHGIDIVNVEDFSRILKIAKKPEYLTCYFSTLELNKASNDINRIEKLAGIFAIKEAVMKALGCGWGNGVSFTDIEISNKLSGKPIIILRRKLALIEKQKNINEWFITLSHTNLIAVASVIAVNNIS